MRHLISAAVISLVLFWPISGFADTKPRYLLLTAKSDTLQSTIDRVADAKIVIGSIMDQMYSNITISDTDRVPTTIQLRVNSLKPASAAVSQVVNSDYAQCCEKNTSNHNCNVARPAQKDYYWIGFCGSHYGFPVAADVGP